MYNSYIMQSSIALTRTQIYITQKQQQQLSEVSRRTSISKSELIRLAVNRFLEQSAPVLPESTEQKLAGFVGMWADRTDMVDPAGFAGMWADRTDMVDPAAYIQALRKPRF